MFKLPKYKRLHKTLFKLGNTIVQPYRRNYVNSSSISYSFPKPSQYFEHFFKMLLCMVYPQKRTVCLK